MLIDVSGSMSGMPLQKAQEACRAMVADMIDLNIHRISLISFETRATVIADFSQDKDELHHAIYQLFCRGGTNIERALFESAQLFKNRIKLNSEIVILVTDGGSSASPAIRQAEQMQRDGIRIVTIGVGHGVNDLLLRSVASNDDYHQIDSINKLQEVFQRISSSLQTK